MPYLSTENELGHIRPHCKEIDKAHIKQANGGFYFWLGMMETKNMIVKQPEKLRFGKIMIYRIYF